MSVFDDINREAAESPSTVVLYARPGKRRHPIGETTITVHCGRADCGYKLGEVVYRRSDFWSEAPSEVGPPTFRLAPGKLGRGPDASAPPATRALPCREPCPRCKAPQEVAADRFQP